MTVIGISSTEKHDAVPMSILRGSSGLRGCIFSYERDTWNPKDGQDSQTKKKGLLCQQEGPLSIHESEEWEQAYVAIAPTGWRKGTW